MLTNRRPADRTSLVMGLLLLAAGAVVLGLQVTRYELPDIAWPYFVVAPGVALLLAGLLLRREPGTGLIVAGSIVSTVGFVLLYQHATQHSESWAYAWTLVGPTAAGLGLLLSGIVNRDARLIAAGGRVALIGGTLFLIGLVLFEGVLGIGSDRSIVLEPFVLPILLVGIGVLVIVRAIFF